MTTRDEGIEAALRELLANADTAALLETAHWEAIKDRAEAALARPESPVARSVAGEAVARARVRHYTSDDNETIVIISPLGPEELPDGMKLYAAPEPATAQHTEAAVDGVEREDEDRIAAPSRFYRAGWEAGRAFELQAAPRAEADRLDAARLDWIEQTIQTNAGVWFLPCGEELRFVQIRRLIGGEVENFSTVAGIRAAIDAARSTAPKGGERPTVMIPGFVACNDVPKGAA